MKKHAPVRREMLLATFSIKAEVSWWVGDCVYWAVESDPHPPKETFAIGPPKLCRMDRAAIVAMLGGELMKACRCPTFDEVRELLTYYQGVNPGKNTEFCEAMRARADRP